MKQRKIIENVIITICFIVVIAFPWVATFLGVEDNLSGAEEKIEFSFENVDDYIIQNFPGSAFLVRSKNQILYSLFDISPNSSITKVNDTLFSTETLNYYYHGLHKVYGKDVDELIRKLKKFNEICASKNKKFAIIITPQKTRYYNGVLPFADDIILAYQYEKPVNSYNIFRQKLEETELNYFDCIDYIDKNKNQILGGKVPLFYNTSHHWTNYKANLVGVALQDFLRKKLEMKVPMVTVKASPSELPSFPDADLFRVLNIYDKPNEDYYSSVVSLDTYDNDNFSFTIQGGSFLGGLLFPFTTLSVFGEVLHIENKTCIYDKYSKDVDFESYDDLDKQLGLLNHLRKTNVYILEINELNVYNASFGFLDYLLEHEEDI